MNFSNLNLDQNIYKAIEACGYSKPTPIQARSIPDILNKKDLVASAQTGTGKTAAFVLPALQRLSEKKSSAKPRVLVLTPTRELAAQITQAAGKYGKFIKFNMVSLVGGMSYRQQIKGLSRPLDMVIATPGRLIDHIENRRLDLSGIEMLILDEADRMLDMGFIDDVKWIAKATPNTRQTLLFSATVDDRLNSVIKQLLTNPARIDLSNEKMAPSAIKQEIYIADSLQHKAKLLQHFLSEVNIFKAIIFSATKINADKLANQLSDQGFAALPLHGDLKQSVRNKTVEQFRRGKAQFLIATDVAARGLDISDVTHVINYDLPKFSEDYVHRIGRTGRAGKEGLAISFVLPSDGRHLQKIERYVGQRLEIAVIPGLEPKQALNSNSPAKKKRKNRSKNKSNGYHADGQGKNSRDKNHDRKGYENRSERSSREGRGSEGRSSERRSFEERRERRNGEERREKRSFEGRSERNSREGRGGEERSRERKGFEGRSERSSRESRDRKPSFEKRGDKEFRPSFDRKPAKKSSKRRSY